MTNIIRRVYVDSSAVGGAFNKRIAEQTQPFWNAVHDGRIVVILSDVLDEELRKAPERAKRLIRDLKTSQFERVVSTREAKKLAARYILPRKLLGQPAWKIVCIFLATLVHADVLVSWNFKHIVNAARIRGYNGINMKLRYSQIDIRTPYEVIHDEV